MKLFASPTSPFARKVRVALIEKGLGERIGIEMLDPWSSPEALLAVNPLSQVPTLVTDDALPVTDCDTILAWLERHVPEPALLPSDGGQRDACEAIAALAQGLIQCTVDTVIERRKPEGRGDAAFVDRRRRAISRVLGTLEQRFDRATDRFHLDGVGVACALSYLDLRLPDFDWRAHSPALAEWHAWAADRPSMRDTAPPA